MKAVRYWLQESLDSVHPVSNDTDLGTTRKRAFKRIWLTELELDCYESLHCDIVLSWARDPTVKERIRSSQRSNIPECPGVAILVAFCMPWIVIFRVWAMKITRSPTKACRSLGYHQDSNVPSLRPNSLSLRCQKHMQSEAACERLNIPHCRPRIRCSDIMRACTHILNYGDPSTWCSTPSSTTDPI